MRKSQLSIRAAKKQVFRVITAFAIIASALFPQVSSQAAPSEDASIITPAGIVIAEGWEYRLGESPLNAEGMPVWITGHDKDQWKPFKVGQDIPGAESSKYVWFRVRLPDLDFPDPVLKCFSDAKRLDVYVNGAEVYNNDYLDLSGLRRADFGVYPNLINLPGDYKGSLVYFREKTGSVFQDAECWYPVELGSYRYISGSEPGFGSVYFIFGAILFFVSLLLLVVVVFTRIDIKVFLAFCLISICSSLSLLSMSPATHMLGSPTFWYYASDLSQFILPAALCLFFMQTTIKNHKKLIGVMWKVFLLHALAVFILDVMGIVQLGVTTLEFFILFAVATVILVMLAIKGIEKSNRETRVILFGSIIYGITGFTDIILGIKGGSADSHQLVNQWGLFVFIVTLILSMVLRYNESHRKSVSYSEELEVKNRFLKEAWDEIKVSHDEVEELNRTLEQKVVERTEQLGVANQELEAANGELTAVNEELTAMNEELTATMEALTDAQTQLVQSEKMAALGKLVAGVAHDLNTPVATIKSNIQFEETLYNLVDQKGKDSVSSYFEAIEPLRDVNKQACERIVTIVRNLVNFSRLDESDLKEANLVEGLESTISVLGEQLAQKKITISKNYSDIPMITCYPKLLNQVFLNLLENAVEAVDTGGKITIGTRFEMNRIYIEFKDNGVGIPAENINKIFDPGYTTKGVKVGISLGLALAYRIVEKHDGRIVVESTPGKGSRFIVELPADKKYDQT